MQFKPIRLVCHLHICTETDSVYNSVFPRFCQQGECVGVVLGRLCLGACTAWHAACLAVPQAAAGHLQQGLLWPLRMQESVGLRPFIVNNVHYTSRACSDVVATSCWVHSSARVLQWVI
jgi:hypothetical protein